MGRRRERSLSISPQRSRAGVKNNRSCWTRDTRCRKSRRAARLIARSADAGLDQDCPAGIRALISVANYNHEGSRGEEEGRGRGEEREETENAGTRRDIGHADASSPRRKKNSRPSPRRKSYSGLVHKCVHYHHLPFTNGGLRPVNEQATGPPSLPGSLLRPSLLILPSPFPCLCLSVPSGYHVFFLSPPFLVLSDERTEEKERYALLIYDKKEDLDDSTVQFPRRDLRNSSRRETKGGEEKDVPGR